MKTYKEDITLNKNSRGCYILDTVKGCPAGALNEGKGCYGDCYAKNIATRYGFDFEQVRERRFNNETDQIYLFGLSDKTHTNKIIKEIAASDMPFVRIGEMGDPSLAWDHTIKVCSEIAGAGKPIVIITKHWKNIPVRLLGEISKLDICINTSVSALDNHKELEHRLRQFENLKKYCHSVLRIVSCDFNREHHDGLDRAIIQEELFKIGGEDVIETVFRPSPTNHFVVKKIINTSKVRFLRKDTLASVYNKKTYFGMCSTCPDMCGIKRLTSVSIGAKL